MSKKKLDFDIRFEQKLHFPIIWFILPSSTFEQNKTEKRNASFTLNKFSFRRCANTFFHTSNGCLIGFFIRCKQNKKKQEEKSFRFKQQQQNKKEKGFKIGKYKQQQAQRYSNSIFDFFVCLFVCLLVGLFACPNDNQNARHYGGRCLPGIKS